MKKYRKLSVFFGVVILAVCAMNPAFAETQSAFQISSELCDLISEFQSVFKTLRTLAFVGAGFIMAKYGWEAISSGKIGGKAVMEGLKETGVAMIVGFTLLFIIGVILSVLLNNSITGCDALVKGW